MIIEKKNILHPSYNLSILHFIPEATEQDKKSVAALDRMNRFYHRLGEAAASYVTENGNSGRIRRYHLSCEVIPADTAPAPCGEMTVQVCIHARIRLPDGAVMSAQRTLSQRWKSGMLREYHEE